MNISVERSLMIVDDDPSVLAIHEAYFSAMGFKIEAHNNPLQALARLQEEKLMLQALLIDNRMPQMTGEELAQRVKGFRPDLPIVGVSGTTKDWAGRTRRELGIDLILEKPVILATAEVATKFIETYASIPIKDRGLDQLPQVLRARFPS